MLWRPFPNTEIPDLSCVTISPSRFKQKGFRAAELFADAELHDVWAFELPTGTDKTLMDLRSVLRGSSPTTANWKVKLLFGMRFLGGKLLGLDSPPSTPDPSYIDRLTPEERGRSLEEPGTTLGGFRTVYVFENEAANEISNKVVHAVSVMAIEPLSEGYTVYWAIYLRRKSSAYMKLIDPFRLRYIYPAIIDRFQREWLETYPQATRRTEGAERPNRNA
jgi:hypothetical protein